MSYLTEETFVSERIKNVAVEQTKGTVESVDSSNILFYTLEDVGSSEIMSGISFVENLKQTTERILSDDYNYVYEYFKKIFIRAKDFNFIIAKARRAYMLARIFCCILINNEKDNINEKDIYINASKKLRSDIYLYSDEYDKNAKVIVLDDIIIHGRALNLLLHHLISELGYKDDQVIVSGIVINEKAECISKKLSDFLVKDNALEPNCVNMCTWKRLSNKFVALIQNSGQSYTAFTDSFIINNVGTLVDKMSYCVDNAISGVQKEMKVIPFVYFENNDFQSFVWMLKCLRCYKLMDYGNRNDEVVAEIAVPFVNLPMMSLKMWKEQYSNFFKIIQKNSVTLSKKDVIFAYKLTSNIVSDYYAMALGLVENTTNNLMYSFGIDDPNAVVNPNLFTEIDEWLDDLVKCSESGIGAISQKTDESFVHFSKWGLEEYKREVNMLMSIKSAELWYDVLRQRKNINVLSDDLKEMIDQFLDILHRTNEANAAKNQSRLSGIPIYALFVILQCFNIEYNWGLTEKEYREFYSYIVSLWDVGIATYNVEIFKLNGVEYIGGCITDGEQAYHALMEPNSSAEIFAVHLIDCYTHDLDEFYNKFNKLLTNTRVFGGRLNSKRLEIVCEYFEKCGTLQELREIYPIDQEQKEFLQRRIYSLCTH